MQQQQPPLTSNPMSGEGSACQDIKQKRTFMPASIFCICASCGSMASKAGPGFLCKHGPCLSRCAAVSRGTQSYREIKPGWEQPAHRQGRRLLLAGGRLLVAEPVGKLRSTLGPLQGSNKHGQDIRLDPTSVEVPTWAPLRLQRASNRVTGNTALRWVQGDVYIMPHFLSQGVCLIV